MRFVTICALAGLFFGLVRAESPDSAEVFKKLIPNCYVALTAGQYVKARYFPNRIMTDEDKMPYRHLWQGSVVGRLGYTMLPAGWLTLKISAEAVLDYNNWPLRKAFSPYLAITPHYGFCLHEAHGLLSFLRNRPGAGLEVAIGQFAYKYNPEVRDLGEYLFRTGTYPLYIINKFDFPLARLTGLRLGYHFASPAKLFEQNIVRFTIDGMLLTEREMMPFHDFSLAFIGTINMFNALELGGGVNFARLFPVDDDFTTPQGKDNMFLQNENDTGYYTFKGAKIMIRATVDPVFFLRGREGFAGDWMGQNGCKLYSEIAVIGLENYPAQADSINGVSYNPYGYDDLSSKMPVMIGFTLPMWKLFDVFAVELEYLDCPYPNDYKNVVKNWNKPLPVVVDSNEVYYTPDLYARNNWKFCIYAKKNIGRNFSILVQIARDHLGWNVYNADWNNEDYQEAFVNWDEWGWHLKTEFWF